MIYVIVEHKKNFVIAECSIYLNVKYIFRESQKN